MGIFYQEEPSINPSKKCKCLALALKDAFTKCHSFFENVAADSTLDSEEALTNFDEEEEILISAIISKYIESKSKRKSGFGIESFNWGRPPMTTRESLSKEQNGYLGETDVDEFRSANGRLSRCSSDKSLGTFVSARTCFSRCSSFSRFGDKNVLDFSGDHPRSIILELVHCEGWPFGLCRKALLLLPLPKSPADSWSWRKSERVIRIH